MIDAKFWKELAENWAKDDDGLEIPPDQDIEGKLAEAIEEDVVLADAEIEDVLAELGLDDFF